MRRIVYYFAGVAVNLPAGTYADRINIGNASTCIAYTFNQCIRTILSAGGEGGHILQNTIFIYTMLYECSAYVKYRSFHLQLTLTFLFMHTVYHMKEENHTLL